ncbi:hypothetical protein CTAYLR_008348 [Chrysophaeum taylorii]|uniref:Peptide deformylase n=1 Tax=Chrysophaeum taylorii TaxID=2483200 RepID=A0AAD7XLA8_9STRA|nr:hypothetical protein CTAYLR_008348 [Chrysophaeum taylorii]
MHLEVGRRFLIFALAQPPAWVGTRLRVESVHEFAQHPQHRFARYPDPTLRLVAKPVTAFDSDLRVTAAALIEIGKEVGAVGLAATQCGIDAQLVVLGDSVFVNPKIVERSDEVRMVAWRERCLVLPPDVEVETLRDVWIVVSATDLRGHPFTQAFQGELARAMQHEIDHARGILIVDHSANLVHSALYPRLADLEAPFHAERRHRAWARH